MFEDVLGQDRAKGILSSLIRENRIPFGVLVVGPRRAGKFMLAVALARALNCNQGGAGDCKCPTCKKINLRHHSDVKVIEPNEHGIITVDQIRAVVEAFSYRLFEGRRKVCLVRNANRMNQTATNAFLKVLEEPKGGATVVLTTSSVSAIPATIKSRCQTIHCGFLDNQTLTMLLMRRDLESDPVAIEMMGGSFMPEAVNEDIFLMKPLWEGKEPPAVDKIEEQTLRNELIYTACALAHMVRNGLSNFRQIQFRRASANQLAELFQHLMQAISYLDQKVRPYLVLRYAENRIREALAK